VFTNVSEERAVVIFRIQLFLPPTRCHNQKRIIYVFTAMKISDLLNNFFPRSSFSSFVCLFRRLVSILYLTKDESWRQVSKNIWYIEGLMKHVREYHATRPLSHTFRTTSLKTFSISWIISQNEYYRYKLFAFSILSTINCVKKFHIRSVFIPLYL
jgi:hypothetical protein